MYIAATHTVSSWRNVSSIADKMETVFTALCSFESRSCYWASPTSCILPYHRTTYGTGGRGASISPYNNSSEKNKNKKKPMNERTEASYINITLSIRAPDTHLPSDVSDVCRGLVPLIIMSRISEEIRTDIHPDPLMTTFLSIMIRHTAYAMRQWIHASSFYFLCVCCCFLFTGAIFSGSWRIFIPICPLLLLFFFKVWMTLAFEAVKKNRSFLMPNTMSLKLSICLRGCALTAMAHEWQTFRFKWK